MATYYTTKRRGSESDQTDRKKIRKKFGLAQSIKELAEHSPWWGYKRIAVVARREGLRITNKQVYRVFKAYGLLQKKRVREAALYQAARLFELLPQAPNELWQADVTYLHIPGHGWWYAVTVIDYYSRYLLACYFTASYTAGDVATALDRARAEAERWHGPLAKKPFLVTDNGPSFIARRFRGHIKGRFAPCAHSLPHTDATRVYWNVSTRPSRTRRCIGGCIKAQPRHASPWKSSGVATTKCGPIGRWCP